MVYLEQVTTKRFCGCDDRSFSQKHITKMYKMTGHPIVDAIGQINITGNVTPQSWYQHIRYSNKRGNYPDLLGVAILSDLVYWYRPTEVRDENTLHLVGWRKKFQEDKLQRSPEQYVNLFGASSKQVRSSLKLLEKLNIIDIELRSIKMGFGTIPTAMFIGINPTAIAEITYQVMPETIGNPLLPNSATRDAQFGNKGCPIRQQGMPNSVTRGAQFGNNTIYRDYTKNTHRQNSENQGVCENNFEEENKPSRKVERKRNSSSDGSKVKGTDPFTLWKQEIPTEMWEKFVTWKAEQAPPSVRDPLGWAYNTLKSDLDRAQLSLQSFQNEENDTILANENTTPNFASWSEEEHLQLAALYLLRGVAFLKENSWHLQWVEYINANLPTLFEEIQERSR